MTGNYSYTRFKWLDPANLNELKEKLIEKGIEVEMKEMPTSENDLSPYKKHRTSLYARADTLRTVITAYRATLSQIKSQPFTSKDMILRELILEVYPRNSSSFFPWGFNVEPAFTVIEE